MTQSVPEDGEVPPTANLEPGTLVAQYRVEKLLGEGGMGAVYRAEHVHMRKAVALKVLRPDASEYPEVVERFKREAIAAAHIDHPNVVSATDSGELPDGSVYLVLEYVDGENLRDVIAGGKVDAVRALHVVREIASALVVAHASGVVHRDIKPENVMLVARGTAREAVKLFDFGIAKIDVGSVTGKRSATLQPITRIGTIFGTPDYMAPEQAMGQSVDGRADLYSLGVVLFEMLTGTRPFKGGAVTLMRQHILQDAPELPDDVARTLDPRIAAVLKRLLAKDPAGRFSTSAELVDAIDAILGKSGASVPPAALSPPPVPPLVPDGKPSRPMPPKAREEVDSEADTKVAVTPPGRTWRPVARAAYSAEGSSRRRRRTAIAGAVALVALGAGVTFSLMRGSGPVTPAAATPSVAPEPAPPPAPPTALVVPSATPSAPAAASAPEPETKPVATIVAADDPAPKPSAEKRPDPKPKKPNKKKTGPK